MTRERELIWCVIFGLNSAKSSEPLVNVDVLADIVLVDFAVMLSWSMCSLDVLADPFRMLRQTSFWLISLSLHVILS